MSAKDNSSQKPASLNSRVASSSLSEAPSDNILDKNAATPEMEPRRSKRKLKTPPTNSPPPIKPPSKSNSDNDDKPPAPKRRKTNSQTSPGSTGSPSSRSAVVRRLRRLQEGNLHLENGEGFMPSANNTFKFKYDSPVSGRTAAELDVLLSLPVRAPLEVKNKYMKLSYDRFGELPARGKLGAAR